MSKQHHVSWRVVILPIGFLLAICALLITVRMRDAVGIVLTSVLAVSVAWDLATRWRKRYWNR